MKNNLYETTQNLLIFMFSVIYNFGLVIYNLYTFLGGRGYQWYSQKILLKNNKFEDKYLKYSLEPM